MQIHWQYGLVKVVALIILLTVGCSQRPSVQLETESPRDRLQRELTEIFEFPAFANAFWGVAIQSLQTGEYLYLRNANKGFIPASNMKLLATAVALVKLGPDFVYQTDIFLNGQKISDERLVGDLVVRGSGDPGIGGHFVNSGKRDAMLQIFKEWAGEIKNKGIKTIEGHLVGDDNCFSDQVLGHGWAWNDESEWYAAQNTALSFNDNCLDLYISPADSIGKLATIETFPRTNYVQITNEVFTVENNQQTHVYFERVRGTNKLMVSGSIAINSNTIKDHATIENPTLYFVSVFKDVLVNEGLEVKGQAFDIDDLAGYNYHPSDSNRIIRHTSPPLSELIKKTNKDSQNLWAELLLRTLGRQFNGVGSYPRSIEVIKTFLSQIGIDPEMTAISDGSGLSRLNLLSPLQVITILRYLYRHPHFEVFYNSLSVAGVDGTLRGRMRGTLAENNIRAKTGTLNRVKALSGYLTTRDGEDLVFSMTCNNYTVPTSMVSNMQDLVCERLANFSKR